MGYSFEYAVTGDKALFSDPVSKLGGDKWSYPVPTREALKGITEAIFWHPPIDIHIDAVRVMKPIQTFSYGTQNLVYKTRKKENSVIHVNTYLYDVEYRIRGHMTFNRKVAAEQKFDRMTESDYMAKYHHLMLRHIKSGGHCHIYLGVSECQGYIYDTPFDEGEGAYDQVPSIPMGCMVYGLNYRTYNSQAPYEAVLWYPVMKNGIITFPAEDDPSLIHRVIPNKSKRKGAKA